MMLLARSRSYCPLVFAISFTLTISAGLRSVHAQDAGLDLPDPEEIQRLINEVRRIVAKAGECVAVADETLNDAVSANAASGKAEEARDDAESGRMTIESIAGMVKTKRQEAERAAERAVLHAATARTAADNAVLAPSSPHCEPLAAEVDVPTEQQALENSDLKALKEATERSESGGGGGGDGGTRRGDSG